MCCRGKQIGLKREEEEREASQLANQEMKTAVEETETLVHRVKESRRRSTSFYQRYRGHNRRHVPGSELCVCECGVQCCTVAKQS